jgi:hypothetical protein
MALQFDQILSRKRPFLIHCFCMGENFFFDEASKRLEERVIFLRAGNDQVQDIPLFLMVQHVFPSAIVLRALIERT